MKMLRFRFRHVDKDSKYFEQLEIGFPWVTFIVGHLIRSSPIRVKNLFWRDHHRILLVYILLLTFICLIVDQITLICIAGAGISFYFGFLLKWRIFLGRIND